MPISLQYHAGGRKVDEIASWVGLGWNLAVGGVINREVRQYPDDYFVDRSPPYGDLPLISAPYGATVQRKVRAKGYLRNVEENCDCLFNTATGLQQGYLYNDWMEMDPDDPQSWQTEDGFEAYFGEYYPPFGDYQHWKTGELADISAQHELAFDEHLTGYDLEPDVFRYNFNGYSGTFLFDYKSNIIQVPVTDLKIEKTSDVRNIEGKLDGFKITTPDGTIYYFETIENTESISKLHLAETCDGLATNYHDNHMSMTYKSSWLMTKVITPLGQIIDFEYEDYTITYQLPIHKTRWETGFCFIPENGDGVSPSYNYENTVTINTKLLKKVETSNVSVYFVHSQTNREDLTTSKSLEEIKVWSKATSSFVKIYSFDYDYFLTKENDNGSSEKRLKLNSVQEYNNSESKPPYRFDYNTQKLPELNSPQQDMFGYYNANGAEHMIPQVYIYTGLLGHNRYRLNKISSYPEKADGTGNYGTQYFMEGADRTLNNTALQACMLKKIEYPTGGISEFFYEPNEYYDEIIDENIYGGGLRIAKQISKGFSSSADEEIEYSYVLEGDETKSSGMISNLPVYAYYVNWVMSPTGGKGASSFVGDPAGKFKTLIVRHNMNQNPLEAAKGATVGYTRTVVDHGQNGLEEFYYSFPMSANQDEDNTSFPGTTFERSKTYKGNSYTPPFAPNPDYSFWRGLLLEKKIKDANGKMVMHEEYKYRGIRSKPYPYRHSVDEWFKVTPAVKYNPKLKMNYATGGWNWWSDDYFAIYNPYITNCVRLTDKYVRTYDMQDDTNQDYIETHEQYAYLEDNIFKKDHLYPAVKRTWNSNNEKIIEGYIYPSTVTTGKYSYSGDDYESATLSFMVKNNIINKPYEVIRLKDFNGTTKVLGAELVTYKEISIKDSEGNDKTVVVPSKIWEINTSTPISQSTSPSSSTFTISDIDYSHDASGFVFTKDNHYELEYTVDAYDSYGNPVQQHKTNGLNTVYVWGYNGKYPIAKIVNATYSEIETALSGEAYTLDMHYSNNTMLEALNQGYIIEEHTINRKIYLTNKEVNFFLSYLRMQSYFPDDAQVTTFTYKPLVGITSETDINGRTTYYEYDDLGRLSIIKDHDGNILKQYEYHYKNESDSFILMPSIQHFV